jgi:hypothetical protein
MLLSGEILGRASCKAWPSSVVEQGGSMRRKLAVIPAVLAIGALAAPASVSAAPIDCPGGQTATKTASGWDCVNRGGNTSNAEDPKNPNVGKGFF